MAKELDPLDEARKALAAAAECVVKSPAAADFFAKYATAAALISLAESVRKWESHR